LWLLYKYRQFNKDKIPEATLTAFLPLQEPSYLPYSFNDLYDRRLHRASYHRGVGPSCIPSQSGRADIWRDCQFHSAYNSNTSVSQHSMDSSSCHDKTRNNENTLHTPSSTLDLYDLAVTFFDT